MLVSILDSSGLPDSVNFLGLDEHNYIFPEVCSVVVISRQLCKNIFVNAMIFWKHFDLKICCFFLLIDILLGNFRSALNDVLAARKLKPSHLKAIIRGESP